MKLIFIFLSIILLSSCSPEYYCKRCPGNDSIVYKFDTLRIGADTLSFDFGCEKDTIIVERQGRLEIKTIIKNRYIKVEGKCGSIKKVTLIKSHYKTIKDIVYRTPTSTKWLIGGLSFLCIALLLFFVYVVSSFLQISK